MVTDIVINFTQQAQVSRLTNDNSKRPSCANSAIFLCSGLDTLGHAWMVENPGYIAELDWYATAATLFHRIDTRGRCSRTMLEAK